MARPGRPLDGVTRERMARRFTALLARSHGLAPSPVPPSHDAWARISRARDPDEREARGIVARLAGEPAPDARASGDMFAGVRIHTDGGAAASAVALRARAWAFGDHVVFAAGRFAPGTLAGDRLLAHELVHVLQARLAGGGTAVLRDGDDPAPPVSAITLSASLDSVIFDFGDLTFEAGPTRPQLMRLILRRLLGVQYREGLEDEILLEWEERLAAIGSTVAGHLVADETATEGQRIGRQRGTGPGMLALVEVLEEEHGFHVSFSEHQRELLRLGVALSAAWPELQGRFPPWYREFLFRREMAQQADLARRFASAHASEDEAAQQAALEAIFGALAPAVAVLEEIRTDFDIANVDPDAEDGAEQRDRIMASAGYAVLWDVDLEEPVEVAPPGPPRLDHAVLFLAFLRTQPSLFEEAAGDDGRAARLQLLARYARFMVRVVRGTTGDEALLERPATANAPAWDAELTSTPRLRPPLFDAALETDHAFSMQLEWGHWTDAFALYAYQFEFIRMPEAPEEEPPDLLTAEGRTPEFGTVLDTRLARARRYHAADIERVREAFGGIAFGVAVELVNMNAALREIGTVIRSVLDRITQPRHVSRIVFPGPGLFVVRARAAPILEGDEELVRPPSVALLPVVARDPDEMAVSRVRESVRTEFQVQLRMAEIQALLAAPFPPPNAEALQAEMEELRAMLAGPGEALRRRREVLDGQIALLRRRIELRREIETLRQAETPDEARLAELRRRLAGAGGTAGSTWFEERELRTLEDQRETVQDMIETRAERTAGELGTPFTPHAVFVSDLGHSIGLALELYDRGEVDGQHQVYISDLTTPDSGDDVGSAPVAGNPDARTDAILSGVKSLLEENSDYGRGRVAIQVDGVVHTLRVEAGTGRMLMEAVESGTMVLSLAAIAAAPFTQGASLYLLLPLGAIGAIPSAYRLVQRHEEHRLRFDVAAAMDVVNVVAGGIGLAHAATPLRMVRMGRALMVMGMGADGAGILLMGAGIVEQIDALRGLPEHERAARLLEIIGGALLDLGVQAGGAVAHARYQGRRTAAADVEASGTRVPPDQPGFQPRLEPATADAAAGAPGDRSMAGSRTTPPSATPSPPPTPAGDRPAPSDAASPERLFELLGQGIERGLAPPRPLPEGASPPPQGVHRRGLRTAEAAYAAYNEALQASGGREVAIYHDPRTGEYAVAVGSETGVRAPEPHGWNALLHYHPNPEQALTFRLPAPQDFSGLMFRYVGEGGHVREFIEFDVPGVGRGRTEYGIDPLHDEPFYVRIHQPDGRSQTIRFSDDGTYSAYWGSRTVAVEPGSPTHEAMIRDIQAYIRGLDTEGNAPFGGGRTAAGAAPRSAGPSESATTGVGRPGPRTAGQRTATGAAAALQGPLQSGTGDLLPAGVALVRQKFERFTDGSGRRREVSSLSDEELVQQFKNQPAWLEWLVVAEARAAWLGSTTPTDFVMANPRQNLREVAARLRRAVERGATGHTLHEPILEWSVWDYVREMDRQGDPVLAPAFRALETTTDARLRDRWRQFKTSGRRGDMSGFFLGEVGSKQPDVVEVMLSHDAIHVTDASFAYGDPIHNFKSAFYRSVLEHLIDVGTVTATDYRSPLRQTPVGP